MNKRNTINAALIASLALLQGCQLAPRLQDIQVKGKATTQIAGDFDYTVLGKKKPNAIVCMLGLEAASRGHWNNIEVVYIAEHYSLCNSHRDRGEERVGLGLVWKPFR
jgi:hypothetical protein